MKHASGPRQPLHEPAAVLPVPSHFARDRILLPATLAAVLLTLLAVRPHLGVPLNDDFSYAHTARALAESGRIVYNGWASPMLWPQAAYGALLIKAFGFSYTALAASGIVLAALATATMYALARACGAGPAPAALATATLTLNPIFLGVTPSFMTDVPSLFLLLAALLALVKALQPGEAGDIRLDPKRFALSVVLGLVAGSNRQIVWVAYFGALVTLIWLLPRQRRLVAPAAVLVLVIALALSRWFGDYPYTVPTSVGQGLLVLVGYTNVAVMFIYKVANMMGLFSLPMGLLAMDKRRWRSLAFGVLLLLCLVPIFYPLGTKVALLGRDYRLTAYGQYFTSRGVVVGGVSGFENRPTIFPPLIITACVVLGAVGVAVTGIVLLDWWRGLRRTGSQARTLPDVATSAVAVASLASVAASLPWFAIMNIFDRYLLLYLPGLLVLFARAASERPMTKTRIAAAATLLAVQWVTGYGTVAEYMNYTRARAALYERLLASGNAPREVDGGFEFNADTQVREGGHMNNILVRNPPDAYKEGAAARNVQYEPQYFTVLDARYVLSTDPPYMLKNVTADPEPVHAVTYRSPIFPPFERSMYVYRIRR